MCYIFKYMFYRIYYTLVNFMGYDNESCNCGTYGMRNFLTKEEKLEILKEYKQSLEKEAKGVAERIKDLEKNN